MFRLFFSFTCFISFTAIGADFHPLEQARHELAQAQAWSKRVKSEVERASRLQFSTNRCQGRLTTESGVGVSTTSRTNQATLYFTPYYGNRLSLYNGTTWDTYTFTETTLSLSGMTSGRNYDIFAYASGGVVTLTLSSAWLAGGGRSYLINTQDGVVVLNSDKTRRLVGTIRATAATQTQDSYVERFVYNYCQRLPRHLFVQDTANSWSYTTTSLRQADGNTANDLAAVFSVAAFPLDTLAYAVAIGTGNQTLGSDIGLNSTTTSNSTTRGGQIGTSIATPFIAAYTAIPATNAGLTTLSWNEIGNTGATQYGDNNSTLMQSGMMAWVED